MKFPAKELLIALSLAAGAGGIGERIDSLSGSYALILYLGLFLLLAAALLLTAYVANTVLRCVYAAVLAVSALFLDATERVMGEHLSYDLFVTLLASVESSGDALRQYGGAVGAALPGALLLFAGIALKPRWTPPLPRFVFAAGPWLGVAMLSAILFARGGYGARALPSAFAPLSYSSLELYEAASNETGPRQEVRLDPRRIAAPRDVVLIIDESVSANYLDINHAAGVRSGLGGARRGVDVYNYGYAAAVTHCSAGTNLTLRYGGTRADYPRINATMPSIWDYARRAGFRTVYIDAQRTRSELNRLVADGELKEVDAFAHFLSTLVRDRDQKAADALARLLGNDVAEFVIVNKVGAHFPVHDKYPDAFMRYRPVLRRGVHEDVSHTGSRAGFDGAAESWRRYRNSYRNTLLWTVGAFFDRLFAHADLSAATLIYTSDHGQDLHERGTPGLNTHCSGDPVPEEGLVPLVVIEGAGLETLDWDRHLAANRDHVSHYQIFPTLLALLGYDPGEVRPIYGESLIPESRDPVTFNARFNARLGRDPVWIAIDRDRIVAPPDDAGR